MRANLVRATSLLAASLVAGCGEFPTSTGNVPPEEINWPDFPTALSAVRIVVDGLSPTTATGGKLDVWNIYPPADPDFKPYSVTVPRTGVLEFVMSLQGAVTYHPPPSHALTPGEVDTKEVDDAPRGPSGVREVRFAVVITDP